LRVAKNALMNSSIAPRVTLRCVLVVVPVAESGVRGRKDIPNANIGSHTIDGDRGVQSQRITNSIDTIDIGCAGGVGILPNAPVAVNKCVMEEEDRVAGRRVKVHHSTANTVVAESVGTSLRARGHVGVVADTVACVDLVGVCVGSPVRPVIPAETMGRASFARADVQVGVGEYTIRYASSTDGDGTVIRTREDGRVPEPPRVSRLVKP